MGIKKITLVLLVVLLAVVLGSCTTFKLSGAQVTKEGMVSESVGTFDITVKVLEFVGAPAGANLFNITADKMDVAIYNAIQMEIKKYDGDAAVDVVIDYKASFLDNIIGGISFYILAPSRAEITGTIVKYNN